MKEDEESIESVAWCDDRLFIAGMSGSVIELDLLNLSIKVFCFLVDDVTIVMPIINEVIFYFQHEIGVTSGSCWCIAICKENMLLAVSFIVYTLPHLFYLLSLFIL